MKGETILVTGGAGYIGSGIVKTLIDKEFNVLVIDDLSKGEKKYVDPRARLFKIDLCKKEKLIEIFSKNKIDCAIHCAAKKAVYESEKKPITYFENNISGTINLLNAMNSGGCNKIIFSSTACVYKSTPSGIYSENSKLANNNVYGFTKIKCEELIKEFSRISGMEYVIFRYFNVAGDIGLEYLEKNPQNIFPKLCEAIKNNEDFCIFGKKYKTPDGTAIRDYISLSDLIDAHVKAIEYPKDDIFNLGTKKGTSILEIIKEFEKQLNRKIKVKIKEKRTGDAPKSLSDPKKAKQLLKWKAKENLSKIVKDFIKSYKLN